MKRSRENVRENSTRKCVDDNIALCLSVPPTLGTQEKHPCVHSYAVSSFNACSSFNYHTTDISAQLYCWWEVNKMFVTSHVHLQSLRQSPFSFSLWCDITQKHLFSPMWKNRREDHTWNAPLQDACINSFLTQVSWILIFKWLLITYLYIDIMVFHRFSGFSFACVMGAAVIKSTSGCLLYNKC